MTDDELLVADLLLKRFPNNTVVYIPSVFDNLLRDNAQKFDSDTINRLYEDVISKGYLPIRNFLLEQEYITSVDSAFPKDRLTDKGETANRLGGHVKYKEWELKEPERKKKTEKETTNKAVCIAIKGGLIAGILVLIISNGFNYYCNGIKNESKTKANPQYKQPRKPIQQINKQDTIGGVRKNH